MGWTTEEKLRGLLLLPWTIDRTVTPEGDVVLSVREIPHATGSGETPLEQEEDLWESLTASLEAYLHFGDAIPLPHNRQLPWIAPQRGPSFLPADSIEDKAMPLVDLEERMLNLMGA